MKSERLSTFGTALTLLAIAAAHTAAAEVIVIKRGTFTFAYENDIGVFDLAGTGGCHAPGEQRLGRFLLSLVAASCRDVMVPAS